MVRRILIRLLFGVILRMSKWAVWSFVLILTGAILIAMFPDIIPVFLVKAVVVLLVLILMLAFNDLFEWSYFNRRPLSMDEVPYAQRGYFIEHSTSLRPAKP